MSFTVDTMRPEDWTTVRVIYQEGVATKNATFETDTPEWEAWDQDHLDICRFVVRESGNVVAWAALSSVSKRKVYAGVAEVSIYVAESAREKGFGKTLLKTLVESSEKAGIWTLQGGIFPENETSIVLHQLCGFRIVGHRERIGNRNGTWRDVVLMERRSSIVGV